MNVDCGERGFVWVEAGAGAGAVGLEAARDAKRKEKEEKEGRVVRLLSCAQDYAEMRKHDKKPKALVEQMVGLASAHAPPHASARPHPERVQDATYLFAAIRMAITPGPGFGSASASGSGSGSAPGSLLRSRSESGLWIDISKMCELQSLGDELVEQGASQFLLETAIEGVRSCASLLLVKSLVMGMIDRLYDPSFHLRFKSARALLIEVLHLQRFQTTDAGYLSVLGNALSAIARNDRADAEAGAAAGVEIDDALF